MPKPRPFNESSATLGFEGTLWQASDKLRNNMDAAEYKHVVLGLIFLKYICDVFEEHRALLADSEDPVAYRAAGGFWVPPKARWGFLTSHARQSTIGQLIDEAMIAIERENPSLADMLPKDFGRPALDKQRLGELVDLIGTIGLGDEHSRARDVLGRVYEYFLSQFAVAEGRNAGQFFTPQSVVRLLVEMLAPTSGRVLDPCCGSGGMFVQSEKFIESHGGRPGDIRVYGQESNPTTWRLARMNLAIRRMNAQLGETWADSFRADQHPGLEADYVLANPPFNHRDWGGQALGDDPRWRFGVPPLANANFAWIQHILHHLAPTGTAGVVLANGSMSSQQSGEGEIRKQIVEADLVDCMVALPGQLFYSTQIPVCVWILSHAKQERGRRGQTLFIDARKLGTMVSRVNRELLDADIERIAGTYQRWRGGHDEDVPGFCKSATLEEIAGQQFVLTPGRYVGVELVEEDDEAFEDEMQRLVDLLERQFAEGARLEQVIRANLRRLGGRA